MADVGREVNGVALVVHRRNPLGVRSHSSFANGGARRPDCGTNRSISGRKPGSKPQLSENDPPYPSNGAS